MRSTSLALLLITPSIFAQGSTTIPPGFDSTDAPSYGYLLGGYAEERVQLAFDFLKGNVAVVKEIQLRQDGSIRSSSAVGRTWTNVNLAMSEVNFAALSTTFAGNIVGTPTNVFSGSVNWDAMTTAPPSNPAPWAAGGRKFTFGSTWIYSGTNSMLCDFTYTGGTLANSASWTSLSTYYLDGENYQTSVGGSASLYGISSCVPSGSTYTIPDQLVFWLWTYAKNTGTPTNDNTIQGYAGHAFGVASTAHIGAVGPTGVKYNGTTLLGIPIPGVCQPLLLTAPWIEFGFTTNSGGSWSGPRSTIPFNAALVGTEIYAQAGHNDNGRLHLSRVSVSPVRPQPADPKNYAMIYRGGAGSSTATTGSKTQSLLPVLNLQ